MNAILSQSNAFNKQEPCHKNVILRKDQQWTQTNICSVARFTIFPKYSGYGQNIDLVTTK